MIKIGIELNHADGKKSARLPMNWTELKESKYNGEKNFAILTGAVNDTLVIDIDKKNAEFNGLKWFEEKFGSISDMDTLVTRTINGGYHVYFKYCDKLRNRINMNNLHIDILGDKRCAFEGEGYEVICDKHIRGLSEEEIKYFLDDKEQEETMTTITAWNGQVSEKQMVQMLNGLDMKRIDNRDDWIRLGYFLTKYENGQEIFEELSKKSEKFDENRHGIDWESFASGETERPITIGTIIMWLKEDNPELYEKIVRDKRIITELDNITEDYDIKHREITRMTRKTIEVECEMKKALQTVHKIASKECTRCDLIGKCCSNGYILECKNCNFQYPDQRIEINSRNAPTIYNTLTIINKDENINNKDTLQVALRIKKESNDGLIYTESGEWYKYNTTNGIYEKLLDIEVINEIDRIVMEMRGDSLSEEWFDWINKISYKENLIRELKAKCFKRVVFDDKRYLLGFKNGVLDLESNTFRIGQRDEYITMTCNMEYGQECDTSLAESVVNVIFPNEEERKYALKRLAMSLEGFNREQTFTFNYGYGARNGKSFLMERLSYGLGEYGTSFPVNLITSKMKGAGEANTTLMSFKNKRFMYCSEPESGCKLNTNFVKSLTGDVIKARALYSNQEETIKPTFKIFVCCNTLPNFDTYDEGIARRVRLIDFKVRFIDEPKKANEVQIITYSEGEIADIERGLLHMLIKEYEVLRSTNFKYNEPERFKRMRKMYINDNKDEIENALMEVYEKGDEDDYVKMTDIKSTLKKCNAKEKDIITIKTIVENTFEGCEYKEDKRINKEKLKRVFVGIKYK